MTHVTYRIPAYYACALVNDDYSGLTEADEKELRDWLAQEQPGYCCSPEGEAFFAHTNDINNYGSDCYDLIFIKH